MLISSQKRSGWTVHEFPDNTVFTEEQHGDFLPGNSLNTPEDNIFPVMLERTGRK